MDEGPEGRITPDPDEADQQVVLEELYDENYEPTEAEILEYAKWLGMDTENEKELLWIARAGLKEPVPEGWKPCQAPSKEIYYFNFITGESIWDHPCDEHFRKLYAQEKARLEERRQNEAADQQDAAPAGQQYEQAGQEQQLQLAGLQQDWGSQPDTGQQQQQQQQQQLYQQQQQQQVKAPMLQLPNNNAIQHTDVEAMTSPSGTLSTIASGTTVSVAESPVGGLSHSTGAFQAEPAQQQAGNERPSLAGGIAPVRPAGLEVSPMLTPAAAQGARRSLMAGDSQGAPVLAVAARDWRATDAAADQQERQLFRQRLEQERQQWEQHLHSDVQSQHSALQQQHQQRLWALTRELQEQEQLVAAQLKADQDSRVNVLRMELQATLRDLEQELQDAKAQHAAHMQQLRSQHEDLESKANSMLQQAQQRLSATAMADSELSAARDKATAAVEIEALAEASGHRSELLQAALHAVEQEVAAEVASYKATRRAEALQQLAGRLTDDTAAAARQLERQTAELQRLEAAVADKAAVLQKLSEEVNTKQQQQQQQLLHSLSSCNERGGDAQALSNSREQLAAVQQQLAQAEKQLAAADAALLEKRAAVGEAGEQLAALRRETSVCEPRLGSLRQQLQELEANIRARTTEHQQRQADVALSSKRLAELREEVSRRQGQLDSLEALHAERQESLRQTANELSWRRGELSTLESSLSESLRRKADAEYQLLEERLRRTRKAAADAAAELTSSQAALADLSAQVASKQGSLAGVEASLAAKSKELQEVLSQLQAAAAQEFQDAKKLLLKEEARLLESERRSMQLRVTDQIESERRAALAAGRRRLEREIAARLAGEQSASLEQQQKQVQRWLQAAAAGVPPWETSPAGVAGSGPTANGGHDRDKRSQAAAASGTGVAALLGQEAAAAAQWPVRQQQQQASTGTGTVRSLPDTGGANGVPQPAPPAAAAAAGNGTSDLGAVGKRRARSHSPVRNHSSAAAAAAAAPQPSNTAAARPRQHSAAAAAGSADKASYPAATVHRLSERLQAAAGHEAEPAGGVAAGLHAAAAAVAEQLKALGGQLGPGTEPSSWCADLPQLSLLASPATPQTSQQAPGSLQLAAYTSLLQAAKQFVKQRRRDIQTRQEAVMAAQADWKAVLAAMEEQQELHQAAGTPPPAELAQAVQQLRQLKGVLQDQIHGLNDETQQVKGLKARVQQLRATIELLQLHAPHQEQPDPTGSLIANLLTSLSGLQHRQQHWQQQQHQQQQSGLVPSPRVPLQSHNHNQQHHHQQQPWSSSLPPSSPLDKVSAALQAALDAATSYGNTAAAQAAGTSGPDAGGGAALSNGRGSRRSSLQPWPPNGAAGPVHHVNHTPELAAEGSWGTLNKLREERGAAQQAMRQHSQWLQGFRQQVAQVAALQPVVAGKLYQQSHQGAGQGHVRKAVLQQSPIAPSDAAAAAAAAGSYSASLSPVASSSLLPTVQSSAGSLTMGQPLTVDLGSSDQLVIALVHKEAAGSAPSVATA